MNNNNNYTSFLKLIFFSNLYWIYNQNGDEIFGVFFLEFCTSKMLLYVWMFKSNFLIFFITFLKGFSENI